MYRVKAQLLNVLNYSACNVNCKQHIEPPVTKKKKEEKENKNLEP